MMIMRRIRNIRSLSFYEPRQQHSSFFYPLFSSNRCCSTSSSTSSSSSSSSSSSTRMSISAQLYRVLLRQCRAWKNHPTTTTTTTTTMRNDFNPNKDLYNNIWLQPPLDPHSAGSARLWNNTKQQLQQHEQQHHNKVILLTKTSIHEVHQLYQWFYHYQKQQQQKQQQDEYQVGNALEWKEWYHCMVQSLKNHHLNNNNNNKDIGDSKNNLLSHPTTNNNNIIKYGTLEKKDSVLEDTDFDDSESDNDDDDRMDDHSLWTNVDTMEYAIQHAFRSAPLQYLPYTFMVYRIMRQQYQQQYYCTSTNMEHGIRISVLSQYIGQSLEHKYRFAYRVRIERFSNNDDEDTLMAVQLLGRTWHIVGTSSKQQKDNANDEDDEEEMIVNAPTTGVVGHLPVLGPNSCFEYISGAELSSKTGLMWGYFHFVHVPLGTPSAVVGMSIPALQQPAKEEDHFTVQIKPFPLRVVAVDHTNNEDEDDDDEKSSQVN